MILPGMTWIEHIAHFDAPLIRNTEDSATLQVPSPHTLSFLLRYGVLNNEDLAIDMVDKTWMECTGAECMIILVVDSATTRPMNSG